MPTCLLDLLLGYNYHHRRFLYLLKGDLPPTWKTWNSQGKWKSRKIQGKLIFMIIITCISMTFVHHYMFKWRRLDVFTLANNTSWGWSRLNYLNFSTCSVLAAAHRLETAEYTALTGKSARSGGLKTLLSERLLFRCLIALPSLYKEAKLPKHVNRVEDFEVINEAAHDLLLVLVW